MSTPSPKPELHLSAWHLQHSAQQWNEVLGLGFRHSGDLDRLRQATRTGRPFGTPDFVAELEEKLERTLHPRKRGRNQSLSRNPNSLSREPLEANDEPN